MLFNPTLFYDVIGPVNRICTVFIMNLWIRQKHQDNSRDVDWSFPLISLFPATSEQRLQYILELN